MLTLPQIAIDRNTLSGATNSVTLTYAKPAGDAPKHIIIRGNCKAASGTPDIEVRVNGDSGSSYNTQNLVGIGTTESAAIQDAADSWVIGECNSSFWGGFEIVIPDAFNTNKFMSYEASSVGGNDYNYLTAGCYTELDAFVSVTIFTSSINFIIGSSFELAVVDEAYNIGGSEATGDVAGFNLSSIAAGNGDITLVCDLRSDRVNQVDTATLLFNSTSQGSTYDYQRMQGASTTGSAAKSASNRVSAVPGGSAVASTFGASVAHITNYADGSNDRVFASQGGFASDASNGRVFRITCKWDNTSAIDEYDVDCENGNFVQYSSVWAYSSPKTELQRVELGSDGALGFAATISQDYDHLEISLYWRTTRSATGDVCEFSINGDTTDANYDAILYTGASTTLQVNAGGNDRRIGFSSAASDSSGEFAPNTIIIFNYTSAYPKVYIAKGGTDQNLRHYAGVWDNTAAITDIDFGNITDVNFLSGTVAVLSGINSNPSDTTFLPPDTFVPWVTVF
jgi:hypothetical protein